MLIAAVVPTAFKLAASGLSAPGAMSLQECLRNLTVCLCVSSLPLLISSNVFASSTLCIFSSQTEEPAESVSFSLDEGNCWNTIQLEVALDVQNIRCDQAHIACVCVAIPA